NIAHYMIPTGGGNWFLNQQESWTSSSYEFSVCGKLADFDNDGLLDLFVANFYGQSELYINSVQGMPTSATWTSAQSYDSMDCDVGDIDGDGYVDAIISTESDSNFLFHNNNGILSSNPVWSTPEKDDTMGIGLWDVDADGDLDWVEANYNHSKNRIRLNSNGTFSTIIWESPDSMDSWYVEMADLEGDGDLDMVIANEQQVNQIYLSDPDQDGDWVSELSGDGAPFDPTQIADSDGDGFGDRNEGWRPDDCPYSWGDSWRERWGCPDLDGDGQSDLFDPFMQNNTQWTDIDGDGLGDNWGDTKLNSTRNSRGLGEWIEGAYLPDPSPWDYDNDGYEDEGLDGANYSIIDDCSYHVGISFLDRKGCPDYDGDGWSNPSSDWLVSQGADAFPGDPSQWNDSDNDGFGDSSRGNQPDNCVNIAGTSTEDVFGCPDADGDGWSDDGDFDSENPAVWSDDDDDGFDDQLSDVCLNDKGSSTEDRGGCKDYDRDGYSDPDSDSLSHPNGDADAFPFEETQWRNQDGDDYGDNISGNNPDYCYDEFGTSLFRIIEGEIVDWFGCTDQDNDGLYDGDDHCPLVGGTSSIDRFGCPDSDDDGMSDLNDDCELQPGDSTIEFIGCPDTDGDGIPDSIDPEPRDGSGSADDWDADGIINSEDAFPNDSTQWIDGDEDGLGDNPNGTNPDPLLGDKDNDGWPDSNDSFINNPSEWLDTDGDGIGDNTDTDDDGDGYSDILEEQVGTDPKDANSHTVESWELIIPGTRIGLSWWDLLGIMAGLPLASWLGYGLVTRNKRVAEFEEELGKATTKIGIEEVAIRAEHALMLRLIGPHQAIRLERLRAELDDALGVEGFPITSEQTEIVLDDMEQIHEEAYVPEIPDTSIDYQITESDGYEWKNEDGQFHYRVKGGDGVWLPWGE
ncbi:MAG: FG-GAP-like repeat-containing protein, partial [Candidatus Thalassarchaeaceae archaeon]|nr:FG-GAP-like repeat-containing protein [Candidatus Thalassarchaeaceae archaeon]